MSRSGKTPRDGTSRSQKRSTMLDRLEPGEAQAVLHRLLAAHPDLAAEAEQIAESLLRQISFETVADEVEDAVTSVDIDDLNSRAGRHSWGYTEPGEAAWELLQEAVDPSLVKMKRLIDLELETEALEVCKGLLLGLYVVRDAKAHEIVGWAEDFPAETAAGAAATWYAAKGKGRGKAGRRESAQLLREFVRESTPEWAEMLERVLSGVR